MWTASWVPCLGEWVYLKSGGLIAVTGFRGKLAILSSFLSLDFLTVKWGLLVSSAQGCCEGQ